MIFVATAAAATLSGAVLDPSGAPITGAIVAAYDERLQYTAVRTDAAGAWSILDLPAGRWRVRAVMEEDDGPNVDGFYPEAWDYCDSPALVLGPDDARSGIDVVLAVGGRIAGRVLDLDGVPVAGADVLATGVSTRAQLSSRATTTDAEGRFTLVGLDSDDGVPEPYRVQIAASGFPRQYLGSTYDSEAAERVDVERGATVDVGDVVLLDGMSLSGVIYGEPGDPVGSGVVYAYSPSQVLDADIAEDGTWRADGLPPGDAMYWASSDGWATTYYPGADRPTSTRLSVPDEGLDVTDADLSLPAESVATFQFSGVGRFEELVGLLYNSDGTVGRGSLVSPEGLLTIDALWPGEYTLLVYGDESGFVEDYLRDDAGAVRVFEVAEGGAHFEIDLASGASATGLVSDDLGAPIYGAYVYAFASSGASYASSADRDGAWTVTGVPGGEPVQIRGSYTPYCDDDPGYVTRWWPDALAQQDAPSLVLDAGAVEPDVDLVLERDFDHDAMADAWESSHGLDPSRDDAAEDADGDGFSNLAEFQLGTDPSDASDWADDGCLRGGCGGAAALVVFAPLLGAVRRRRAISAR